MKDTRLTLEALRRSVMEQACWAIERARRERVEQVERLVAEMLAEQADEEVEAA